MLHYLVCELIRNHNNHNSIIIVILVKCNNFLPYHHHHPPHAHTTGQDHNISSYNMSESAYNLIPKVDWWYWLIDWLFLHIIVLVVILLWVLSLYQKDSNSVYSIFIFDCGPFVVQWTQHGLYRMVNVQRQNLLWKWIRKNRSAHKMFIYVTLVRYFCNICSWFC